MSDKKAPPKDDEDDEERRADEEEEEEDLADDDGDDEDEDEDEEEAAQAKVPGPTPIRGVPPPPPPRDAEDPTWWAPHAVLGALVLIGVLGFFGTFNSLVGKYFQRSATPAAVPTQSASAVPAATQAPAATARPPMQRPTAQQPAGPVYGAKHLVVQWKGATRSKQERSKEDAKKRAEEALAKAKAGTAFEEVAKEFSDEPGVKSSGGDLGKFSRAGFDPQFVDAVEKLKVGEMSGVVESAFGYHVIVRTQ